MKRLVIAALVFGFVASNADAQCRFMDGTISNTTDPSCAGRMLTYTESATGADLIALGYPVPIPVSSLVPVDGFRTYDSLLALHQDLALTSETVRADIAGATLSGRDIWVYSLGDADATTIDGLPEPAVMVVGGTHPREWQPPEAVSSLFETLAASANDNWLGSYLRDNLQVVLIPVLNVDSFLQTQAHPERTSADPAQPREGRMRRRNLRNPNTGLPIDNTIDTTVDNFWGVDLNRNSSQGWGMNGGSSSDVTSLIYRGPNSSTEPEILALQNAATFAPGDRLRLYMDIHSFTQVYFAQTTGNVRRDSIAEQLARVMRAVQGFKYRYEPDPPNGGIGLTADYFGYRYDIPSWTLETEPLNGAQDYGGTASHGHSGFILPDAEVARMRDEIVASSLIGFYRQAGPPHVAAVRISDVDSGEVRYAAEWQNGNQRSLAVTTNSALVPGNNYRVWIAFSKPMRFLTPTGEADRYPGQLTSPASGMAELQFPGMEQGNDIVLDIGSSAWLDQADGVADGYRRYVFDAMTMDFSVPAGMTVTAATPAVLSLSFADMSDFQLDANPATPVDWQNGAWSGFENENDVAADSGGIDCGFKPFVAMDPAAVAPSGDAVCRSVAAPPPPPPPTAKKTGGGGATLWLLLLTILFVFRTIRSQASSYKRT